MQQMVNLHGRYKALGDISDSTLYDLEGMGLAMAADYGQTQQNNLSALINNVPVAKGSIPMSSQGKLVLGIGIAVAALMFLRKR